MTDRIKEWLQKFEENWKQKKVDEVLQLFSENVEYHETPTKKLENKEEIRKEWQSINNQKNIELETEVFSSTENKHTVKWHLEYTKNNERKLLNGIYLIQLNEEGKCIELWQYCQIE